jgi:hypothetical protein
MSHKNKVEIPDVFGDALINIMNDIHKDNELVPDLLFCLKLTMARRKECVLRHHRR